MSVKNLPKPGVLCLTHAKVQGFGDILTALGVPVRTANTTPANLTTKPKATAPSGSAASLGSNGTKSLNTSGPNTTAGTKRKAENANTDGPPHKTVRQDDGSKSVAKASASPMKPAASVPKAAPAPGSYLDKIQKAKSAQQAKAAQPQVANKPRTVQTAQERRAIKKQQEAIKAATKRGVAPAVVSKSKASPVVTGSIKKASGAKGAAGAPAKAKKPRVDLGYSGTARPKTAPSAPVGRNAQAKGSLLSSRAGLGRSSQERRYASYSEEEEEEDEVEEDDESDDMGGGGFEELEAEEEASLRAARKEDAAALAEENAHRADKIARRKRLEQLAASRKKR